MFSPRRAGTFLNPKSQQ